MNKIDKFIDDLASFPSNNKVFNQYESGIPENQIRTDNLRIFLKKLEKIKPKILLCAEAPGYRGCRLTGVPFTSRKLIIEGLKDIDIFGSNNGYKVTDEFQGIMGEPTATIIWSELNQRRIIPLAWNAFPFHPHKENMQRTNRTPTNKELQTGEIFLRKIIEIFEIKDILAVGNKAEITLNNMSFNVFKVRHPANGGKNQFIEGFNKFINSLD